MEISRSDPSVDRASASSPTLRAHGWERIRGHRLYWELHGPDSGKTVVLLHHGLGSVASWRSQIPELAGQGWRVLAFDRWGYGRSDPRPAFAADFMIQDAREAVELLDSLGVHRFCLLGHSDGGSIALILAAEEPGKVARMVLVAAHVYMEAQTREAIALTRVAAKEEAMRAALRREHGEAGQALVQAWTERWLHPDMGSMDLTHLLPDIRCPTLVIQGELDEFATPGHALDLAQGVQHSQVWLIPGVGHMPPKEIPSEFNRRVLAFLTAEDAGARV